jgi:hypothetical protein
MNIVDSILQEFFTQYNLQDLFEHVEEFSYETNIVYSYKDIKYNGVFFDHGHLVIYLYNNKLRCSEITITKYIKSLQKEIQADDIKINKLCIQFMSNDKCCLEIYFKHGLPRAIYKKEWLHDLRKK